MTVRSVAARELVQQVATSRRVNLVSAVVSGGLLALYVCYLAVYWADECSASHLRDWILGSAVSSAVKLALTVWRIAAGSTSASLNSPQAPLARRLTYWLAFFSFVWLIVGSVWRWGRLGCASPFAALTQGVLVTFWTVMALPLAFPLVVCFCAMPFLCCGGCCEPEDVPFTGRGNARMLVLLLRAVSDGSEGLPDEHLPPVHVFQESSQPDLVEEGRAEEEDDAGGAPCAICLIDLRPGCEVRRLPCAHTFHAECVATWLRSKSTCPLCRRRARRSELLSSLLVSLSPLLVSRLSSLVSRFSSSLSLSLSLSRLSLSLHETAVAV